MVAFLSHDDSDENCTSEIPMKWLFADNTKCWWPTKHRNISSLIARQADPTDKWDEEDVIVEAVGRKYFS